MTAPPVTSARVGLHDVAPDAPEAHVVPVADTLDHLTDAVPGAVCDCCPSVVARRYPGGVGRVVIHHAHDGRPSGDYQAVRS